MSVDTQAPPPETMADLLDRLGDVPLERILLHPPPGTAREEDVLAAEAAPRKRLCELVDGVLVEKAMGFREAILAGLILSKIEPFVSSRDLGVVPGADGMVRLFPGQVRIPDVAFVSWDRVGQCEGSSGAIPQLAPDLVVEVLSPSNTPGEMARKRRDYFSAGVRIVWEFNIVSRSVAVCTSPEDVTRFSSEDSLSGDEVLPGFSLPLAELFAKVDRLN